MLKEKNISANRCELRKDSTAGLNSEKSTIFTHLFLPVISMIYKASSLVSPPMTLGAETPGIHLLLIESTSKDMKMTPIYSLESF